MSIVVDVDATFEHVATGPEQSWHFSERHGTRFGFSWHFHPEFELTLITEGTGTRFVGDRIEAYEPGDLVLIGPQLPHTYVSAPGPDHHGAIVAQFRHDFLGEGFFDRPEFAKVEELLRRSWRGLAFFGNPDTSALRELEQLAPSRRTLALLGVLCGLADHRSVRPLASEHYVPARDEKSMSRIDAVFRLLQSSYSSQITLDDVAKVAHMSGAAVSRFFRRTTGTTITAYLNELRVSAACRQLADTERPVSTIAADSGYSNLSHFNRRFRTLTGMSPREYRRHFRAAV